MRRHPYLRRTLYGLCVGVVVGAAFYLILRAFGTSSNWFLAVAIVVAFIPGSIMFLLTEEGEELDDAEWHEEERQFAERGPTPQ
jgi:F0F1-type ATP synthase assembly protein I